MRKQFTLNEWSAGFELEGTATRGGVSFPVGGIIESCGDEGRLLGIEGEVGRDQFEVHTPVLRRLDDARGIEAVLDRWAEAVERFFQYRGVIPWFSPRSPFWRDGDSIAHMQGNPRHAAMRKGLTRLYGRGVAKKIFDQSAGHNALHVHLSHPNLEPDDFFGDVGLQLVNTFSPLARGFADRAVRWADACGLPPNYDRRDFWGLVPGRGPTTGPYTLESLIERWTSVPRLIVPDGVGGWRVDLGSPDVTEALAHAYHGTLWETVRPSPARPDKPFTIELRLWGAVRPENIAYIIAGHLVPHLAEIEKHGIQVAA